MDSLSCREEGEVCLDITVEECTTAEQEVCGEVAGQQCSQDEVEEEVTVCQEVRQPVCVELSTVECGPGPPTQVSSSSVQIVSKVSLHTNNVIYRFATSATGLSAARAGRTELSAR